MIRARWLLSGFLITMVAYGHTWALVTLLILMTLGHEAAAFLLRKIMKVVNR